METNAAKRLLNELKACPLAPKRDVKAQLPELFVPALWGTGAHRANTLKGRVVSSLQFFRSKETQQNRLYATFKEALASTEPDPFLTQLSNAFSSTSESPLSKLKTPQLHPAKSASEDNSLPAQYAQNVLAREEILHNYSLLNQPETGVKRLVTTDLLKELLSEGKTSEHAHNYWSSFLKHNPHLQHENFSQTDYLLGKARSYTNDVNSKLTKNLSIAEQDKILKKEAQELAKTIGSFKHTGQAWIYNGSYGPKANAVKAIFRIAHMIPKELTDEVPEMLKKILFSEDPSQLINNPAEKIKAEVKKILHENADQLSPEQMLVLTLLAEDPTRELPEEWKENIPKFLQPLTTAIAQNGLLGNIERLCSSSASPEVLDILRILTNTPGVDNYMITGIFFHIFGLMKWIPQGKLLEIIQWLNDNLARLASKDKETQDKAIDDFERLITSVIQIPMEDAMTFINDQMQELFSFLFHDDIAAFFTEAFAESSGMDFQFTHAPYWLKLKRDQHGTFTAYIYSSGHALNFHTQEKGRIQWPMRISFIPKEKLNAQFFERLLMHQFKANYDVDFASRADDLWGEEGTFASLRGPASDFTNLEWRSFPENFDNEWELTREATSKYSRTYTSLEMHIAAVADFLHQFQNSDGYDLSKQKDALPLLQKGLQTILREFKKCSSDPEISQERKVKIECTISHIREIIRAEKEKEVKQPDGEKLLPPAMVSWLKHMMLASDISSKDILKYKQTISWLLGSDVSDAIQLVFDSAEAVEGTSNKPVADMATRKAALLVEKMNVNGLDEAFKNFGTNPNAFYKHLETIEKQCVPQSAKSTKTLIDQINALLPKYHSSYPLFQKFLETNDKAFLTQAREALNGEDTAINEAMQQLEENNIVLYQIFDLLDKVGQNTDTKMIRHYLNTFLKDMNSGANSIRLKNIDLALVLIKTTPQPHTREINALIPVLEQLRKHGAAINEIHSLKAEAKRLFRFSQQQAIAETANTLFRSLKTQVTQPEIQEEINRTEHSFKFLDQSAFSTAAFQAAKAQLHKLESVMKSHGLKPLDEIQQLHELLKSRVAIEKAAIPSQGWLRDALANIYIKAFFQLLDLTLSFEYWTSLFLFQYGTLMKVLPTPIAEFIDHYYKIVYRALLEHIFFFVIRTLVSKNLIEPEVVEALFSAKDHINTVAASFTGKRRLRFELPKQMPAGPNRKHLNDDHRVRPLLAPFARFCPFTKIKYKTNKTRLTQIRFEPYKLEFNIESHNNQLRAMSKEYPGYFIADNQDDAQFVRYGSYLILENSEGKKKVLLPSGADAQALAGRFLQKLGPIAGLAGNLMGLPQQYFTSPHRGNKNIQYAYDVDAQGHLISNKLEELAYLVPIEILSGNTENANHASDQLLALLENKETIENITSIETALWPLTIAPVFLERFLTSDDLGNVFRIRQKLFAAIQRVAPENSNIDPRLSAAIAQAIYQDLVYHTEKNLSNRESFSNEDFEKEEWLLYQSLYRHLDNARAMVTKDPATMDATSVISRKFDKAAHAATDRVAEFFGQTNLEERKVNFRKHYENLRNEAAATINPIIDALHLTPTMGKRQRYLEGKYGTINIASRITHLARDVLVADAYIPPTFYFNSPFANIDVMDSETPVVKARTHAYRAANALSKFVISPNVDWNLLNNCMNRLRNNIKISADKFSRESLIVDFVSYYAIARGEEGSDRRNQLKQLLMTVRGGWDPTSRMLVEVLLFMTNIDDTLLFADKMSGLGIIPFSAELENRLRNRTVESTQEFFSKLDIPKNAMQSTSHAGRFAWNVFSTGKRIRNFALGCLGATTSICSVASLSLFVIGSKIGQVFLVDEEPTHDREPVAPKAAPKLLSDTYYELKWEEDKTVDDVLERVNQQTFDASGNFQPGQSRWTLYAALTKHHNALKASLNKDKKILLDLVNPKQAYSYYRTPVTYRELLKNFFKSDFKALSKELLLDADDLEQTMMRLVARETRLQQLDSMIRHLETPSDSSDHIRSLLNGRRQYDGDTAAKRAEVRRYLCYELGQGSLLTKETFPTLESYLLSDSEFRKNLSKTLLNY